VFVDRGHRVVARDGIGAARMTSGT
jgi:hypothetical protein